MQNQTTQTTQMSFVQTIARRVLARVGVLTVDTREMIDVYASAYTRAYDDVTPGIVPAARRNNHYQVQGAGRSAGERLALGMASGRAEEVARAADALSALSEWPNAGAEYVSAFDDARARARRDALNDALARARARVVRARERGKRAGAVAGRRDARAIVRAIRRAGDAL